MVYQSRPAASMSHPDRWLAFMRIIVGLYFAKAVITKLGIVMVGGIPLPGVSERWINVMPKIVARQASDNPILFYKHFLENTVLTHPDTFAHFEREAYAMGFRHAAVGALVRSSYHADRQAEDVLHAP